MSDTTVKTAKTSVQQTTANSGVTNVLLVGVGGQGVLLVSSIIAQAAILSGSDVKANEVHGMAQRGGSVLAQVRFGPKVYSPLVWEGTVDVLLSLEKAEAVRYAHYLKPNGLAVVSTQEIVPVTVSSGKAVYPADANTRLKRICPNLVMVDAEGIAHRLGNVKAANVVVLGAAASAIPSLAPYWQKALELCVPAKYQELNIRAFQAGGECIK